MALIKTAAEIEALKRGGQILSNTLREIRAATVVGASSAALDALARTRFAEAGSAPSFLGYRMGGKGPAFPGALCVSINEEVVHGLPIPERTIKDGDVVGLDIGMWLEGLATDMATTVIVGSVSDKTRALVRDTRAALLAGLAAIKPGGLVQDISGAIEDALKPQGYGIIRDLVGHGVGHAVHEEPQVPNVRDTRLPRVLLQSGMVLAIEPMVSLGTWKVDVKNDGWTITTRDKSVCAHFEVTIAVTDTGYDLITPWPDI